MADNNTDASTRGRKRKGPLDAVAGRIRVRKPRARRAGELASRHFTVFPSVRVLDRGEEKDALFGHENLSQGGRDGDGEIVLPDSDLLKAVRRYAGHIHKARALHKTQRGDGGNTPKRRSQRKRTRKAVKKGSRRKSKGGAYSRAHRLSQGGLDKTGLLTLGVLLEEFCRELLGQDGDLVFTEAAEDDDEGQTDAGGEEKDDDDGGEGEDEGKGGGDESNWDTGQEGDMSSGEDGESA